MNDIREFVSTAISTVIAIGSGMLAFLALLGGILAIPILLALIAG